MPDSRTSAEELGRSPQSVAQPVGWRSLLELGPHEVAIATKCLSRCPHCQTQGARLPLGFEGAIFRRPTLLTDPELMEFPIGKPRNERSPCETGPAAHSVWLQERSTPRLEEPPPLAAGQSVKLNNYVSATHSEQSDFNIKKWSDVVNLGDEFLISVGRMYKADRAYGAHWGKVCEPATFTPAGSASFHGRVGRELMAFALDVATYGEKPMPMYPPGRSAQKSYSVCEDYPDSTACDMWMGSSQR